MGINRVLESRVAVAEGSSAVCVCVCRTGCRADYCPCVWSSASGHPHRRPCWDSICDQQQDSSSDGVCRVAVSLLACLAGQTDESGLRGGTLGEREAALLPFPISPCTPVTFITAERLLRWGSFHHRAAQNQDGTLSEIHRFPGSFVVPPRVSSPCGAQRSWQQIARGPALSSMSTLFLFILHFLAHE